MSRPHVHRTPRAPADFDERDVDRHLGNLMVALDRMRKKNPAKACKP